MSWRQLRQTDGPRLIQEIVDRLRRLETRTRYVVGTGTNAYVIEVNAAGNLTARHATTGTVTIIAVP
jgi:hypothetical protein